MIIYRPHICPILVGYRPATGLISASDQPGISLLKTTQIGRLLALYRPDIGAIYLYMPVIRPTRQLLAGYWPDNGPVMALYQHYIGLLSTPYRPELLCLFAESIDINTAKK